MIRLEKKYILQNNGERLKFIKFLLKNGFKKIHKDRVNFSIYFDYKNLKFFHDSEEGVSFRKKLRLRIEKNLFINDYKKFNFEIKESLPNFKNKFTFSNNAKYEKKKTLIKKIVFERKIFSKKIIPILSTEYLRSYYFSDKYGRITVDKDLEYQIASWKNFCKSFNFVKKIKDKRIVIEQKLENNLKQNDLITLVPKRFSKYCEGVKILNLNH
tara:strand:+ start:184 stop:822 length:639 start_codon:yes stop_codon:yes gene_type:complete